MTQYTLGDLIELLSLEQFERNLFRGQSRDVVGGRRVFGGQVLAQALQAATATVTNRRVHSLHGYFVRPGDVEHPIVFEVERARDGMSFSNRRVVAIQHGKPILNMAASFHAPEDGLEHQVPIPDVPPPEALEPAVDALAKAEADLPEKQRLFYRHAAPFDFRPVEAGLFENVGPRPPVRHFWFRCVDALPDNPVLHSVLLTYVSDYYLLGTATLPHGLSFLREQVQLASLDHALWFHHAARLDEWLLFAFDSPAAAGARGLSRASVYTRDGRLVASIAQEGLMRVREAHAEEKK